MFGIGPSAPMARYVASRLERVGQRSVVVDATGSALADRLRGLGRDDGAVVLAYGHPYREVQRPMGQARRSEAKGVLVTDAATRRRGTPL